MSHMTADLQADWPTARQHVCKLGQSVGTKYSPYSCRNVPSLHTGKKYKQTENETKYNILVKFLKLG